MIAWGQMIGNEKNTPPKNSLPIIDEAILKGFDAIELDIRISSDNVPVLAHDNKLLSCDGKSSIFVDETPSSELNNFSLGLWNNEPVFIESLACALAKLSSKDIMIDPRMRPDQLYLLRDVVDNCNFDPCRIQFCVYDSESAVQLLKFFPESVLLWKIALPFQDIGELDLDEAVYLGMDGVMLISPLHDQDFQSLTTMLKEKNLKVLYYIHGGWPKRQYPDDPTKSLYNMIISEVDYITSVAHHLPIFKKLVSTPPDVPYFPVEDLGE